MIFEEHTRQAAHPVCEREAQNQEIHILSSVLLSLIEHDESGLRPSPPVFLDSVSTYAELLSKLIDIAATSAWTIH